MKIVSALLLVMVGTGLFIFASGAQIDSWISVLLATLAMWFGVMYRKVLSGVVIALVLILVPVFLRALFTKHYARILQLVKIHWTNLDWRIRAAIIGLPFILAAIPMFFAGGLLWVAATFSATISGNTAAALWVRAFLIPWLAKKAAGAGMTKLAVSLWSLMPFRVRSWCEKRYKHLWWTTMFRIARNKRRLRKVAKNFKLPPFDGPQYAPLP
jgi:hypothetical protein